MTKISNSGPVSQTITSGSAIDKLRFEINNNCPNNINFNSTGLPPGLEAVKGTDYIYEISGTPSSIASGTYNYNVNAYNGTNTETLSGAITVVASSTTNSCTGRCKGRSGWICFRATVRFCISNHKFW